MNTRRIQELNEIPEDVSAVEPSPKRGSDAHWWQRLHSKIMDLGWSKRDLARHSGVTYDSINKYLRGDVDKPRGDVLDLLSKAVGADTKWLLFGDAGKSPFLNTDQRHKNKIRNDKTRFVAGSALPFDISKCRLLDWSELHRCPTLGGRASNVSSDRRGNPGILMNQVAVAVPDNSMAPDFRRGDLIVCAMGVKVREHDLVIAGLTTDDGRKYFFRRYVMQSRRSEPDEIVLNAINKAFPPIKVEKNNHMKILGRIIGYAPVQLQPLDVN